MQETAHGTDDIYTALKNEIISLDIKPGASISENTLCERFGVSRTPIRTALQRLESGGFLTIVPYKGTTVTLLDYRRIEEDIYARVAVESAVMRDFIKMHTPADREAVCYAFTQLKEEGARLLAGEGDVYRFLDIDVGMHNIWFRAINKMTLAPDLEKMDASYVRFMTLDIDAGNNVEDVLCDHGELLDIIDARDFARIEPTLTRHLYGNVRRLGSRLFTEFRDYFVEGSLPA